MWFKNRYCNIQKRGINLNLANFSNCSAMKTLISGICNFEVWNRDTDKARTREQRYYRINANADTKFLNNAYSFKVAEQGTF